MYARATVREIQGFLLDQYKVEVSADWLASLSSTLKSTRDWRPS